MLRSKDQILLESLYEGMIKESPDTVYDNQGNKIMWNANDAFTFGWFKLVPKIEPVYLRAASGSSRNTRMAPGSPASASRRRRLHRQPRKRKKEFST